MCTVCGCGNGENRLEGAGDEHEHADGTRHSHPQGGAHEHAPGAGAGWHRHADGTWHSHDHDAAPTHAGHEHPARHAYRPLPAAGAGGESLHFGRGPAGAHAPGLSQKRMLQIETDILGHNDALAAANRARLGERAVLALNLVSAPGAGKTSLLVASLAALRDKLPLAVIEGDQETAVDAERIRATGVPALQINTGRGCHLDAAMVGRALDRLDLPAGGILFIENVGNLVCPAAFDLGEAAKVAILSVTEGADKPLKYPHLFQAARLLLIHKTDLLPHVDFSVDAAIANARQVNPAIEVICLSAKTGDGLADWLAWLEQRLADVRQHRIAHLEAELAALKGA